MTDGVGHTSSLPPLNAGPFRFASAADLEAAQERLAAVERFARELDWSDDKAPDSDYGMYVSGYREGYIAARRELRAVLGIEEGK